MNEVNCSSTLQILLIGDPNKLSGLEHALSMHPGVEVVARVPFAELAFGLIRRSADMPSNVEAVFIDPFADSSDPHTSSDFILNTRATRPDIVFVLLVSADELRRRKNEFDPELRSRIGHYFTLDPSIAADEMGSSLSRVVEACLAWRETSRPVTSRRDFKYDVAISFAGEDREFAQSLAEALTRRNVRVFLDDYYRATLWGRNLYTDLYNIYANEARYCIILVSRAYRDKMWTGHERQAAQARALEMRGEEYILPVRLEEVAIQGIPPTVSYLRGDLGVEEIANIFITKLASGS